MNEVQENKNYFSLNLSKSTWVWAYFLISCAYQFLPSKVPFVGARNYGNEMAFLYTWSARNVKPSFFQNPPLLGVNPDWCVAYGLSGLDGGEGGYLCGYIRDFQKRIYALPRYDCSKRLKTGGCLKLKEDIAFTLSAQEFIKPYKNNNLTTLDILHEKDAFKNEGLYKKITSIRNVRSAWSSMFNPEKDWGALKFHHGNRKSLYKNIFGITIFLVGYGIVLAPIVGLFLLIGNKTWIQPEPKSEALSWAKFNGYPIPYKPSNWWWLFALIMLFNGVLPGIIIFIWRGIKGKQYEQDLKSWEEKWIGNQKKN